MPNGFFWAYFDVLNVAGAMAMSGAIAVAALRYWVIKRPSTMANLND
jgi:hypothetical protein